MCKLKVTKFQVFCLKSKLICILSNHQQTYSRNFGQVCKPQVLSSNELHKLVKPRVNFIATTLGESPAQWPHCPAQQASSQGGGGGISILFRRGRDLPIRAQQLYLKSQL